MWAPQIPLVLWDGKGSAITWLLCQTTDSLMWGGYSPQNQPISLPGSHCRGKNKRTNNKTDRHPRHAVSASGRHSISWPSWASSATGQPCGATQLQETITTLRDRPTPRPGLAGFGCDLGSRSRTRCDGSHGIQEKKAVEENGGEHKCEGLGSRPELSGGAGSNQFFFATYPDGG